MIYIIPVIIIIAIIIAILKLMDFEKSHEDTFKDMIEGLPSDQLSKIKDSLDKLDNNPVKDKAIDIIDSELNKRK